MGRFPLTRSTFLYIYFYNYFAVMVLVIVVIVLLVVIVVVDSIWANFTFSTIWPFYGVMLWPLRVARWLLSLYLQFVHILFYSLPFYSILCQCLLVVGQKVACRPKETLETLPCSSNVVSGPYRFWPTSTSTSIFYHLVDGGKCWPTAISVPGIIRPEKW